MPETTGSGLSKLFWAALAVAALWLWLLGAQRIAVSDPQGAPPAGALQLEDTEGRRISLEGLRGRVVLINLWASWCAPCRAEVPRLARVHRDLEARGLVVLGLNQESLPRSELARLKQEWEMPYPVVVSLLPLEGTEFAGEGAIPHNWLIDRQGRVRASRAGLVSESSLRRAATRLLDEGPSDAAARLGVVDHAGAGIGQ